MAMIINEFKTPQVISDFSERAKKGLQSGLNFAKNHKLAISMVALTAIAAATTFYFYGSQSPSPTSPIPRSQPQPTKKVIIESTEKIQQVSKQVIPEQATLKADSTALVLANTKVEPQPEQNQRLPLFFKFFFLEDSSPPSETTIPKEELPSSNPIAVNEPPKSLSITVSEMVEISQNYLVENQNRFALSVTAATGTAYALSPFLVLPAVGGPVVATLSAIVGLVSYILPAPSPSLLALPSYPGQPLN